VTSGGATLVLAHDRAAIDVERLCEGLAHLCDFDKKTLSLRLIFAPAIGLVPDFAGAPAIFHARGRHDARRRLSPGPARARKEGLRRHGRREERDRHPYLRRRFNVDDYLLAVKLRDPVLPRRWDAGRARRLHLGRGRLAGAHPRDPAEQREGDAARLPLKKPRSSSANRRLEANGQSLDFPPPLRWSRARPV